MNLKSLTHKFVNIFPQKLHDQDKERDEKGKQQRTDVGLQYEPVQLLQNRWISLFANINSFGPEEFFSIKQQS